MNTSTILEQVEGSVDSSLSRSSTSHNLHEWVQREVVEGSGISPCLAKVATKVLPDLVIQNGEVVETPIHEALNWDRFTRFGQQATPSMNGLFFLQETGEVFQVKLDNPRTSKDGKLIKYETPVGNGARAYLPPVDVVTRRKISERMGIAVPTEGSFWQWVKENSVSVIKTEGPKKSLSLLSDGYIAIALNGVNGGYRVRDEMGRMLATPELIPDLQEFKLDERIVVIANDAESDERKRNRVGSATNRFGALLAKEGALVYAASWKPSEGKGIDDLKVNRGIGRVTEVIARARPIKAKKLTKMQIGMMVARSLRVRLNELTWQVELDGKTVKLAELWCSVCESSGLEISKDYFVDACLAVAAENSYHPIVEFLDGLASVAIADPRKHLVEFFGKFLGLVPGEDDLQIELCIKWAIGAVKRVYEPGCFLKNMLIVQGGQNAGKSSLFRALAGEKWFGDPEQTGNAKDDAIIPHMCWLVEMSELETVYKRKDVSQLKAHLSRTFDMLRRPYAREFEKIDRRYSLVGTTNKSTFLYDSTGSVRFWVVELKPGFKIPFKEITGEVRNQFWAAVRSLYKANETTEPTDEQWEELSKANKKFEATQDFEAYLLRYIDDRKQVSTTGAREWLQQQMPQGDRVPSGVAIKEFLESLGWRYSSKLVADDLGRRVRMLTAPSDPEISSDRTSPQEKSSWVPRGYIGLEVTEEDREEGRRRKAEQASQPQRQSNPPSESIQVGSIVEHIETECKGVVRDIEDNQFVTIDFNLDGENIRACKAMNQIRLVTGSTAERQGLPHTALDRVTETKKGLKVGDLVSYFGTSSTVQKCFNNGPLPVAHIDTLGDCLNVRCRLKNGGFTDSIPPGLLRLHQLSTDRNQGGSQSSLLG